MELLLSLFFVIIIAVAVFQFRNKHLTAHKAEWIEIAKSEKPKPEIEHLDYAYRTKSRLMTYNEERFFRLLAETVSEKYYVFPQVHLSTLFDHEIKGQSWKGAFAHINGKSVDYVLCGKTTLKPVYAIELDDFTHNYENRIERDARVEKIFAEAGMPLVRFKNLDSITQEDIVTKLSEAYKNLP